MSLRTNAWLDDDGQPLVKVAISIKVGEGLVLAAYKPTDPPFGVESQKAA